MSREYQCRIEADIPSSFSTAARLIGTVARRGAPPTYQPRELSRTINRSATVPMTQTRSP